MKRMILIFLLLLGCANNQKQNSNNYSSMDFSNVTNIEEFMIKLKVYANNSPYPNIDD
tara:strand:- start:62 stop:235 length:174 start_codon:yes stop_codon:yes gene_type:complete